MDLAYLRSVTQMGNSPVSSPRAYMHDWCRATNAQTFGHVSCEANGRSFTFSVWQTVTRRARISLSASRVKRTMAHRDWMGSMILLDALQARAKRVVLL